MATDLTSATSQRTALAEEVDAICVLAGTARPTDKDTVFTLNLKRAQAWIAMASAGGFQTQSANLTALQDSLAALQASVTVLQSSAQTNADQIAQLQLSTTNASVTSAATARAFAAAN